MKRRQPLLRNSRQIKCRSHCCNEADLKKATAIREKQATAFSAEEKEMQGGASMMQIKTAQIVGILKRMRCNCQARQIGVPC